MQGVTTIRACGASKWFISRVEEDLDNNGKWWFAFMGLCRWVGFRLDCLSAGTLLVGSVLAMLLRHKVVHCLIKDTRCRSLARDFQTCLYSFMGW